MTKLKITDLTVEDFIRWYKELEAELADLDRQEEEAVKSIRDRRAEIKRQLPEINRSIAIWGDQPLPRGRASSNGRSKRARDDVKYITINGKRMRRTSGDKPCIVTGCDRTFESVRGARIHATSKHNVVFAEADYPALLKEKGTK